MLVGRGGRVLAVERAAERHDVVVGGLELAHEPGVAFGVVGEREGRGAEPRRSRLVLDRGGGRGILAAAEDAGPDAGMDSGSVGIVQS